MYVHQQLAVLAIVKASAFQNNVHVKKWEFFVQQNVIQNELVVKIWVNRVKYFHL
jgi:hypothetical protein